MKTQLRPFGTVTARTESVKDRSSNNCPVLAADHHGGA